MKFFMLVIISLSSFYMGCGSVSELKNTEDHLYGPSGFSKKELEDKNTMPLNLNAADEKQISTEEKSILNQIDSKNLIQRIKDLALTSSKTYNGKGNLLVHNKIFNELSPLGFTIKQYHLETDHPGTTITYQGKGKTNILIIGHSDTVLTASEVPLKEDTNKIYGSGVIDMKGTLAAIVESFKTLHATKTLDRLGKIQLVISSDEEKAGKSISDILQKELQSGHYDYFLEIEGGYEFGRIVAARKGILAIDIDIHGQSAHSGNNPLKGLSVEGTASALTHKILQLQDLPQGTTVNVVRKPLKETVARNKIPNKATLWIESRSFENSKLKATQSLIESLVKDKNVITCNPHINLCTKIEITNNEMIAPLFATQLNKDLAARFKAWSKLLKLPVKTVSSGGISDLNHAGHFPQIASVGGLGLLGGGQHTKDEYVLKDYILKRTQMLTLALLRLSN